MTDQEEGIGYDHRVPADLLDLHVQLEALEITPAHFKEVMGEKTDQER